MSIKNKIQTHLKQLEVKAAREKRAVPPDNIDYNFVQFKLLEKDIIKPVFHEAEQMLCSKCFEARVEQGSVDMADGIFIYQPFVRLIFTQHDFRGNPQRKDCNSVKVSLDIRRELLVFNIQSVLVRRKLRPIEEAMELPDFSREVLERYTMKAIMASVRKAPCEGVFDRITMGDRRSRREIEANRKFWPASAPEIYQS